VVSSGLSIQTFWLLEAMTINSLYGVLTLLLLFVNFLTIVPQLKASLGVLTIMEFWQVVEVLLTRPLNSGIPWIILCWIV